MHPRILFVYTYYPEFLTDLYASDPALETLEFEEQRRRIEETAFGVGEAYVHYLRRLGCDAQEVIVNADVLQARWAAEHDLPPQGNIHDQRRRIVAAQVEAIRPDVLFVFEWCPLGDTFLAEMKSRVRLVVGQIASPLHSNRTYAAYHLMVSSFPPLVDYFRAEGLDAAPLRFGFDPRLLDGLPPRPPRYDVTFVGGIAPSHPDRIAWLEGLIEAGIDLDVFGYGFAAATERSPIRPRLRGQAWGRRMFEVLAQSRVSLNRHARIDIAGRVDPRFANNMRLFEATGVGTCLVTDAKENLAEMFEPGREVVTYRSTTECAERIHHLLSHESERAAIAAAGQTRTLRDHSYADRMADLLGILRRRL